MTCRSTSTTLSQSCEGGGGQQMTYDALRRLLTWQNAPGSSPTASEQYAYDGEGNRVWQQATSVNGSTTTTTDTVYALGVDEQTTVSVTGQQAVTTNIGSYPLPGGASAQRDGTGLYYLATDQLGTPIAALRLTDGTLTGAQLRTPYGQARYAAASTSNGGMHTTAGFTGQHEDVSAPGSSGLTYFNARYYDPLTSQFISADTVLPGKEYDPWELGALCLCGG